MWKQWCGIGKNIDLETDWHPVPLSTHITTVGLLKTWDSWRRRINPLLVWFLAWKCPSLTDSLGNHRAPTSGCPTNSLWFSAVNPLSWCEIQPVLRPCVPAGLEDLFLSISDSKGWAEDMGGGNTAAFTEQWQCSWRLWQPFLPSITPCP